MSDVSVQATVSFIITFLKKRRSARHFISPVPGTRPEKALGNTGRRTD
jgi:hypothetical protein